MKRVLVAAIMMIGMMIGTQAASAGQHMKEGMGMDMPSGQMPKAAAQSGAITGKGVVKQIDKANGKVKMTHDPIEALGWPKMTMMFRVKDPAMLDKLKEGDQVSFGLEKGASGYVINKMEPAAK